MQAAVADTQCCANDLYIEEIAMRHTKLSAGPVEVTGMTPDRKVGHEVAVILENLRFGVRE